jgi:hypothetical protein
MVVFELYALLNEIHQVVESLYGPKHRIRSMMAGQD